jgi:cell wall-associated NlpC family hydrolase
VIRNSKKRLPVVLIALALAALAAAGVASATPAEIQQKKAEAEQVLAQIAEIDAELGLAIEAYNSATLRLDEIEEDIRVNQRHLAIARRAYKTAQGNLANRIVALYVVGEQDVLEVLLGSASLDDLLDRVDSVQRISAQDVAIIEAVRDSRAQIRTLAKKLAKARAEQQDVVASRAAQRESIEDKLAERQQLYESIKDQIVQLEAEERERQRRLAEEAERRREAERAAAAAAESSAAGASSAAAPSSAGGSTATEEVAVASEVTSAPPAQYGGVVDVAMQYLGTPYVWGGASPAGFDCSGLVVYAYGQIGVSLPHYTGALWQMGSSVSSDQLAAGDLVFFNGLGHMGIYIGGGQFIHSPHTGDVVKISSLSEGWYASTYVGARRI